MKLAFARISAPFKYRRRARDAACRPGPAGTLRPAGLPATIIYWSNWQFRRLRVEVEPKVAERYAFPGWLDSVNARSIKDPSSRHGEILETDPSQYPAGFLHSGPLRTFGSPGLYEVATFRIRQVQAAPLHKTALTLVVGNANNLVYGMGAQDIFAEDFPDNPTTVNSPCYCRVIPGMAFSFGAVGRGRACIGLKKSASKNSTHSPMKRLWLLYDGVCDGVSTFVHGRFGGSLCHQRSLCGFVRRLSRIKKLRLPWQRSYVSGDVQNPIRPAFSSVPLGKTRLIVWCNASQRCSM